MIYKGRAQCLVVRDNRILSAFILFLLFTLFLLLISCSNSKDDIITGNDPNNTIFLHNAVCEDEDYVYYSGEKNIVRINKKDESLTELEYDSYYTFGDNLNLYKGYLYFVGEKVLYRYEFYRVNLNEPNNEPELVSSIPIRDTYLIFDNKIYVLPFYTSIFRMNPDGSDVEEYDSVMDNYYYICGNDDKYVYTVFRADSEQSTELDGVPANAVYMSRMTHKDYRENNTNSREKLFKIYTYIAADLTWFNDFMVISDGYVYYKMGYGDDIKQIREAIIRNKLSVDSEREIIYEISQNEIVELIAVTKNGIYFKKYNGGNYTYGTNDYKLIKISLDGKIETELEHGEDWLFFVSKYDSRLHYIKDNKIFLAEE